jgi:hypothetical protein
VFLTSTPALSLSLSLYTRQEDNAQESRGTQTEKDCAGQGSAVTVNYRPVLSSERAPQNNKPETVRRHFKEKEKLATGADGGLTQTGRLTLGRKMTLTLAPEFSQLLDGGFIQSFESSYCSTSDCNQWRSEIEWLTSDPVNNNSGDLL